MSVSPPGHWLLNRMVFLLNKTLGIINSSVLNSIKNLLKDANTFTGINTFKGGINVDNIDSINGNTIFNSEIIVNSNITANNGSFIGDNLVINIIEKNTNSNVTFKSSIDMSYNNINAVDTIFSNTLNINTISLKNSNLPYITVQDDIRFNNGINVNGDLTVDGSLTASNLNIDTIHTNPAANISVFNTIDMNNNYIINANIAGLNHSQINVENGLINSRNLILGGFNADLTNGVTFRSWHGLNLLENTKVVLYPNDTLYLPENNGRPFGSNNSEHTQSIIGIGGLYKVQNNTQQFLNSNCYLIPPSMVSNETDLQGTTLFKTIGEQTQNIQHLAGYQNISSSINELKNTLVPTVGQIVDLLNYLGLDTHMNGKQGNLASTH